MLFPPSSLVLSPVLRAVEGDVKPSLCGNVVAGAVRVLCLAYVVQPCSLGALFGAQSGVSAEGGARSVDCGAES